VNLLNVCVEVEYGEMIGCIIGGRFKEVSVSNDGDSDLHLEELGLDVSNDCFDLNFASINPRGHGTSAVHYEHQVQASAPILMVPE
jgi:hypothetical protein